jgi:hypothetical protein
VYGVLEQHWSIKISVCFTDVDTNVPSFQTGRLLALFCWCGGTVLATRMALTSFCLSAVVIAAYWWYISVWVWP